MKRTSDRQMSPTTPFAATKTPLCQSSIEKHFPNADKATIYVLGHIWDEVVHRTIDEMTKLALADDESPLHINIREDMVLELAKLQHWLGEIVIDKRIDSRALDDIDPNKEREACLGPDGDNIINGTARLVYEKIWKRKMEERWKPKSAKAVEREKNPRKTKLAIKPVGKNHFISRWFIRDNWANDGKILRWRWTGTNWSRSWRGIGQWGYQPNLYSDTLEAYFALLEGDAKRPIQMILDTHPLNAPQRESFVGFLIIHMLRNPVFVEILQNGIASVIAESGYANDPTMPRRAYEAIFQNNELYDQLARPIMWSRWVMVRSEQPVFVLPDTFSIQGDIGDRLKVIVPLTPNVCFATLPERENEKRIVPLSLQADDALAQRISSALIQAAQREFISHSNFIIEQTQTPTLDQLLNEIGRAIGDQSDDE